MKKKNHASMAGLSKAHLAVPLSHHPPLVVSGDGSGGIRCTIITQHNVITFKP